MNTSAIAFGLVLTATPALAFGVDFSGTIGMGLFGTSAGGDSGVTPYLSVDAEAMVSFQVGDDGLTVEIVLPLDGEFNDNSFLPTHR